MKKGIAMLAVAALVGVSATAAEAGSTDGCTWIYMNQDSIRPLFGSTGSQYMFEEDGIEVTATATADGAAGTVHQGIFGLGVKSDGFFIFPDQVTIDGVGQKEVLKLSFNQLVRVDKILFGRSDPFGNGDQAKVTNVDTGDEAVLELDSLLVDVANLGGFDQTKRTGTMFEFTTTDKGDNYKVKAVKVTPIPTPAAAGTGLLMLAGLAFKRRRRLA